MVQYVRSVPAASALTPIYDVSFPRSKRNRAQRRRQLRRHLPPPPSRQRTRQYSSLVLRAEFVSWELGIYLTTQDPVGRCLQQCVQENRYEDLVALGWQCGTCGGKWKSMTGFLPSSHNKQQTKTRGKVPQNKMKGKQGKQTRKNHNKRTKRQTEKTEGKGPTLFAYDPFHIH